MNKILTSIILLMASLSATAADGTWDSTPVHKWEYFTNAPVTPPLDTPYLFGRKNGNGAGTHELMSLIFEQSATADYTYPWNLYVQTTLNNSSGQGVGITSRQYNNANGWSTAIHAEPIAKASGTNIGFGAETSPITAFNGRMMAFVANAKDGYGEDHPGIWSEVAYDIVNDPTVGFTDGLKIDSGAKVTYGFHIKQTADTTFGFINESALTDVAIYTGPAPTALRMNANKKICLENTDNICFFYDSASGRIQFRNNTYNIGYIDTSKTNNVCMNC
jgi:hypothetical protein